ncbi:response regulator transcription factor [Peribacillus butanolivorans]|uniref:response regulator transcription factor n=1 Tax=Peribacillus butanolivorans TaxID=421767 RepID=UPI00207D04F5|nr:response regulator transcription factor [Peribacillus butanolivorans]MCO0596665.1 response regulator transcription factor [Peribacillus butanolivorans]
MKKILIIEDEENLLQFIRLELEYEGYEVIIAYDGREGLAIALNENVDLILLDLMLPGLNGIEVCRRIRSSMDNTPIIMITARDSVLDKISGLDSGADDYISKPFQIEELLARMRAIFRRSEIPLINKNLSFKDLELNLESRIVKRGSEPVELTKKEFDLLFMLMKNVNRVLTREFILEEIWGYDTTIETNIVDVYISYLRSKVDGKEKESYIQTVRGTGYVLRD